MASPKTGRAARRAGRGKVRRARRALAIVATVATLSAGGVALVRSSLFAVDGIDVRGLHLLHREDVLAASGLHLGMNVLSVHPGIVRSKLRSLPLVASADVQRIYPSKVRIVVVERTPAAAAQVGGEIWLVGADGLLIERTPSVPAGLPAVRIAAKPGSPALGEAMRLWAAMPSWARQKTSDLGATDPSLISARIGGTQVIFGDADDVIAKMEAVVAIFERAKTDGRRVVRIDVRAPTRPAAVFA